MHAAIPASLGRHAVALLWLTAMALILAVLSAAALAAGVSSGADQLFVAPFRWDPLSGLAMA
jgi:hypothetical protein